MPRAAFTLARETRRELRGYAGILLAFLAAGLTAGVLYLVWKTAGDRLIAAWSLIPVEMRVILQLSLLLGGVTLAGVASIRAYLDWAGRSQARARAKETPPIVEFGAGSVTAVALTRGEGLEPHARRELDLHRRKYLVRPKDAAARAKRDWGAPVLFVEPTRAGDTRLAPVMALAAEERRKHQRNLLALQAGAGQLSTLRVMLGVGRGYTSLSRAHALREDLARTPAKFRMNLIVTDEPSAAPPPDGVESVAVGIPVDAKLEVTA